MPNGTVQGHSPLNVQETTESDKDRTKRLREAQRASSATYQASSQASSFGRVSPSDTGPRSAAEQRLDGLKVTPLAAVSSSEALLNTRSTKSLPSNLSTLALQGADITSDKQAVANTLPASAAALRAMRQRQPLNDYRRSLGAAVKAKKCADGLEDNELLGRVFSIGFPSNQFDLQIKPIDAMIVTAFSFGQVLRDFSNPDVCKQYTERNNEVGDTFIREQIVGAEQNCRYFAEEAHRHVSKAAGAVLAVQAELGLPYLQSNAEALEQALPSNIDDLLAAHQEALRWRFVSEKG